MSGQRRRLLDLFCGAGGAARGYQQAGFHVVGVDIAPQPRYVGDEFYQADALEYLAAHGHEFDVIHASPPCQSYSRLRHLPNVKTEYYPKLVGVVRDQLDAIGRPYVIENVEGAPLYNAILLCGVMFDLRIFRHRLFETYPYLLGPAHVEHPKDSKSLNFRFYSSFEHGATHISLAGHAFRRVDAIEAMHGECSWMTRDEMAESIPPQYTHWLGQQLQEVI